MLRSLLAVVLFVPATALAADLAKATPEDSKEIPLPAYKPVVESLSMKSALPCPQGAIQYTHEEGRAIYCAVKNSAWGKGRTGPVVRFHANGKVVEEGEYRDSKSVGTWRRWDESGVLETYAEYAAGVENGLYVRNFANGKRQIERHYANGKKDGVEKMWYESGQLWTLSTFKQGKQVSTKTFQVDMKVGTKEDVDAAWKKVRELEEEQRKLMQQPKPEK